MKRILLLIGFVVLSFRVWAGGEDTKLCSLSPVPLSGSKLTVKLNVANSSVVSVELRNLIGRRLQEKKFPLGGEEVVFEEMSNYPSGIYVVLAKDSFGKIVETSKFIINK